MFEKKIRNVKCYYLCYSNLIPDSGYLANPVLQCFFLIRVQILYILTEKTRYFNWSNSSGIDAPFPVLNYLN